MLASFLWFVFCAILLLLPLVFWMFLFLNFYEFWPTRKQFLFWIALWMAITLPFFSDISGISFLFESLFLFLQTSNPLFFGWFHIILFLAIVLLWTIFFLFQREKRVFLKYIFLSYVSLFLFSFVFFSCFLLFFFFQNTASQSIAYKILLFSTTGALFSYYLLVAGIEEISKFLSLHMFFWSKTRFSLWEYLCFAGSISLGFAFFENIIYSYYFFQDVGYGQELYSFIFMRSIFSLSLHVLASFTFVLWGYVLHSSQKILRFSVIFVFLFLFSFSTWSHMFYDIWLHFGWNFIPVLYLFFLYVVMVYLSQKELQKSKEYISHL